MNRILLQLFGYFAGALAIPMAINHLLMALALFLIARARKIPLAWLAWLPVGQSYTLGAIADDIGGDRFFGHRSSSYRHILACISIANTFASGFSFYMALQGTYVDQLLFTGAQGKLLGTLLEITSLAISVVSLYVLYKIFVYHCRGRAVIYTLLAVFIPFAEPILLLVECYVNAYRRQPGTRERGFSARRQSRKDDWFQ